MYKSNPKQFTIEKNMKKALSLFTIALCITFGMKGFSQTWDQKSVEKRKFEILYKLCKLNQGLDQKDFTDLFANGLLKAMIQNITDPKSFEQIKIILDNSRSFFDLQCTSYLAKVDSIHESYIRINKADSIVMPKSEKKE
ncbi:MAG: hypothetical protein WCQ41_07775 [Bacillota bacterium]